MKRPGPGRGSLPGEIFGKNTYCINPEGNRRDLPTAVRDRCPGLDTICIFFVGLKNIGGAVKRPPATGFKNRDVPINTTPSGCY